LHILKFIKNKNIWGVSTGFYAILLALEENPESKIIISGIGMQGGKQFINLREAIILFMTQGLE